MNRSLIVVSLQKSLRFNVHLVGLSLFGVIDCCVNVQLIFTTLYSIFLPWKHLIYYNIFIIKHTLIKYCRCLFFCEDKCMLRNDKLKPWLIAPKILLVHHSNSLCQMKVNSANSGSRHGYCIRIIHRLNIAPSIEA